MGTVPGLTPQEQADYKEAYRRLYEAMDGIAPNPAGKARTRRASTR